jgi:hypothetical protein
VADDQPLSLVEIAHKESDTVETMAASIVWFLFKHNVCNLRPVSGDRACLLFGKV